MKNYENTALLAHKRRFDARRKAEAIARRVAAEQAARAEHEARKVSSIHRVAKAL